MTRIAIPRGLSGALGAISLVLLGACAAQQNDGNPDACANPKSVACSHTGGVSSTGGTSAAGAGNGGTASGLSGSTSSGGGSGGTSDPNAGAGTTSTVGGASGGTATGGSSGTNAAGGAGGTVAGGTAAGGTAAGGTAAGGTAAGGTAAGGTAAGGTSGSGGGGATGMAGAGGVGGAHNPACTTAIPARTSWLGTASSFSNVCTDPTYGLCNPPAYAFDADASSRFSTGKPQAGTEWLQIDFTTKGTVDELTVSVSNGDFGRHLQIRMSDVDQDTAAPVLAEMDGVTGPMTFKFAPKTARFILISQTKALATGETSWWSVQDISAACK